MKAYCDEAKGDTHLHNHWRAELSQVRLKPCTFIVLHPLTYICQYTRFLATEHHLSKTSHKKYACGEKDVLRLGQTSLASVAKCMDNVSTTALSVVNLVLTHPRMLAGLATSGGMGPSVVHWCSTLVNYGHQAPPSSIPQG